jgi:hypothetical protein
MADDGRRQGVPEHAAGAPGTASGNAPAESIVTDADGIDSEAEALAADSIGPALLWPSLFPLLVHC